MDKLAILIVNYETPELVENLVDHIHTYFPKHNYDLTVIDNSLINKYEKADVFMGKNAGFDPVVMSWLANKREEEYAGYWLICSDIKLEPYDYTETFLRYLRHDKTIGLMSPILHEERHYEGPRFPQNKNYGYDADLDYIDLPCTVISHELAAAFEINDEAYYFLGGLDLDFNYLASMHSLKKIQINSLEAGHVGTVSYRQEAEDKEANPELEDLPKVNKAFEEHKDIKGLDPNLSIMDVMYKSIQDRYGQNDIFRMKMRWMEAPVRQYYPPSGINKYYMMLKGIHDSGSNRVVVTGMQRSGTTFISEILAKDLEIPYHDEGDWWSRGWTPFGAEGPFVHQNPQLTHAIAQLADDGNFVVFVHRNKDDVYKSIERVKWIDDRRGHLVEYYKYIQGYNWRDYSRSAAPDFIEMAEDSKKFSAEEIYDLKEYMWETYQKPYLIKHNRPYFEIWFEDMEDHPKYIKKENRKDFHMKQTS